MPLNIRDSYMRHIARFANLIIVKFVSSNSSEIQRKLTARSMHQFRILNNSCLAQSFVH